MQPVSWRWECQIAIVLVGALFGDQFVCLGRCLGSSAFLDVRCRHGFSQVAELLLPVLECLSFINSLDLLIKINKHSWSVFTQ